jgi:cytochrome c
MYRKIVKIAVAVALFGVLASVAVIQADEFTKEDQKRWQDEFMSVVQKGRDLWVSPDLGSNGVACAQCHPNAANTHPETYPKFQQQLGRVITLREMINWCLMNPLEGATLDHDDPDMIAMEAYVAYERRGVEMAPGKH